LDFLSGGRVLFGIGGGWNVEEMENHGTVFKTRWKAPARARRGDEGDLAKRDRVVSRRARPLRPDLSYPKPVQKPHPPILLGGHGEAALRRVVAYCDGWLPISLAAGDLKQGITDLRRFAQEKGRDPSRSRFRCSGPRPIER